MAKFKAVSAEEKNALTEAIRAIEKSYKPHVPDEITTVRLEPITELEDKAESVEEDSLISFGGMAS